MAAAGLDDRIYCDACLGYGAQGCALARQASVPVNPAPLEDEESPRPPHRCVAFRPRPGDPDQRDARGRWPGLFPDAPDPGMFAPRRRVRPPQGAPVAMPADPPARPAPAPVAVGRSRACFDLRDHLTPIA